jgi:hypothetical protein
MLLENWSVSSAPVGPYDAPEMAYHQLSGNVFGHPRFDEGKRIRTSDIKSVNGREVVTRSGSVYTLGEPHVEYVHWCREQGCHVPTAEEPIKLL